MASAGATTGLPATGEGCAPGRLSHRLQQRTLVVSDCGEHEDEVWLSDARFSECLLGGFTTRDVRIMVVMVYYLLFVRTMLA